MPKRDQGKSPYSHSESKYELWEKQNRGTGTGPDYIPRLNIIEGCSSLPATIEVRNIKAKDEFSQRKRDCFVVI